MPKLSKFGEDFLLLALRIDKHIKGYVDFYFGPEKLRQIVDNGPITSPNTLLNDSNNLIKQLGAQGYNKERERYIEKLVVAMKTSIEILIGSEISVKDQFTRLYDVYLQPAKESELDNLKEEFEDAYRGSGNLKDRMNKLRTTRKVPESKVFKFFKKAVDITEKQTKELFIDLLPKNERIIIDVVNSSEKEKYSCYNWYLGKYISRIEVNPNYQMYWTSFLKYSSHEAYPGHHTEFVVKEERLYRELNQFEHSLLILHSPKLVISEGIANKAISILFSNQEVAEIGLNEFCSDPLKEVSIEELEQQNIVKAKIPLFWYNLAYHALVDRYDEKELMRYGKNLEIFSDEDLITGIERMSNPAYSNNAFMYYLGNNILQKYGDVPSLKNFQNLLVNPILPSDLI
ncbi:MAG: hypothetical protein E3J90_05790 [Promethearchaeota archaeon]|nr:MAG: hypothetical protein E3J90_05790 [Candidatus Lokiarchaeota archaeon]